MLWRVRLPCGRCASEPDEGDTHGSGERYGEYECDGADQGAHELLPDCLAGEDRAQGALGEIDQQQHR